MVIVTLEPAGITTRPEASVTSLATVPLTVAPGLSILEVISRSTVVESTLPAASASGAGAGAGFGLGAGFGAAGFGFGLAATGAGGGTGVAAAWSLRMADESTGSRCRSRLRAVGRHACGAVAAAACEHGERQNCQSVSRHESSSSGVPGTVGCGTTGISAIPGPVRG